MQDSINSKDPLPTYITIDHMARILDRKKPLIRHDVKTGLLKPDIVSDRSGIPHSWGKYSATKDALKGCLSDLGIDKKTTAMIIDPVDQIFLQNLWDGELRYIGIFIDTLGNFERPFFFNLMNDEYEPNFEEFDQEQSVLIIVDARKVVKKIIEATA